MEYAQIAWQVSNGKFPIENHFAYRFALVLPTSLSYLLLGVNDLASSIPPLLAAIGILYFVSLFLRNESKWVLFLALSICTFSPWFLRYSTMLMPDIYVCLGFVSALYFLWKAQEESVHQKTAALGFCLSLFFGFLAKGTIVLILPTLLLILLINVFQRKNVTFWIWSGIFGIGLLAMYFFGIYLLSNDPFMRFKVIGENTYLNRCSYAAQNSSILLKRISIDFLKMIQRDHLLLNYLFLGFTLLYLLWKQKFEVKKNSHFTILAGVTLLLSANFMSISLEAYNPMCLDIRHYLYLIPIGSISLALLLLNTEFQKLKWGLLLVPPLGLLISYQLGNPDFFILTLPFALVIFTYLILSHKDWSKAFILILLPLVMVFKPIEMMKDAGELNYEGRKKFVLENLIKDQEEKLILTDPVQANLGNYYLEFETDKIQFEDFRNYKSTGDSIEKPTYYLYNWHSAQQSFITNSQVPFYLKSSKTEDPIKEDKPLAIAIYRVKSFQNIQSEENLLLTIINDFEETIDPWTGNSDLIVNDPLEMNNKVSRVPLYSSTFQFDLDSLKMKSDHLYLQAQCKVNSTAKIDAKLVISIETSEGAYFYESQDIDPLIKSYSNWWEVHLENVLNVDEIKPNSRLKVYVWNVNQGELLIDNFEIRMYSY